MSSGFPSLIGALMLLSVLPAHGGELRVCADPNNLPFSNQQRQGLENRVIELVAADLGLTVAYTWWAQRRGFVGEALNADLCDVVPGIARVAGVLLAFPPYYRSSYAFVSRSDLSGIESFDDPRLRTARIGVQLVGDDGANTPPAEALARRGVVDNVRGYSILGDYRQPSPPSAIIEAVASNEIDIAVAWGPMAGYFAARQTPRLRVTPVAESYDYSRLPMVFDIFVGVREDMGELRQDIEEALDRRRSEVDAILAQYDVPRLDVARTGP